MSLISQITQMKLQETVGPPLRHQRDQRDLRRLLEDSMKPEVRRAEDSSTRCARSE
jgi:hypothetical protein